MGKALPMQVQGPEFKSLQCTEVHGLYGPANLSCPPDTSKETLTPTRWKARPNELGCHLNATHVPWHVNCSLIHKHPHMHKHIHHMIPMHIFFFLKRKQLTVKSREWRYVHYGQMERERNRFSHQQVHLQCTNMRSRIRKRNYQTLFQWAIYTLLYFCPQCTWSATFLH